MDSNIKNLKSFFEYVKKNEKKIYKKIFQTYGLPTSKIKKLPKEENELLLISTGINLSVEEKLSKLIELYEYDNAKIFSTVKDDFEFNSKVGFFEVLNEKSGKTVHVVDLKSSIFETLLTDSNLTLDKGDMLFGFSFFDFEKGDTIVTSGYSSIFPEGIFVGIVEDYKSQADDNFYSLKVKLSTDFSTLKDVLLIKNKVRNEQVELERKVRNAKK